MLGISEATRHWQVSERTLRRRLSNSQIDGAERDDMGQWLIPTAWLASEFSPLNDEAGTTITRAADDDDDDTDNLVIDLRDGAVASGLAEALAEVSDLTNRVIEAEVTAALATNESDNLNDRVRRLQGDLDSERARGERLRHDLSETENALALDRDRRARSERDLEALTEKTQTAEKAHLEEIDHLRNAYIESRSNLAALEAFVGERKRAKFRRFRAG